MARKKPAEPEKPKRGRPATGRKRDCQLLMRLTAEERAEIDAAAGKAGLPVTIWALGVMLAAARQASGE